MTLLEGDTGHLNNQEPLQSERGRWGALPGIPYSPLYNHTERHRPDFTISHPALTIQQIHNDLAERSFLSVFIVSKIF
jgi:hypothetical protein